MANWLDKYNDDIPNAQNGIEGTMGGLTDKGFNYNGAWGGTMQMGGSLPGSAGFMYARTISPAPSNGKYAKKTKASAQTGESVVKTDTGGGGDTPDDGYIPIPGGFNRTITTGVSETFDPTNPKWRGNDSQWLRMKIKNDSLMANLIADAKSLPKSEWKKKYEGKGFALWNGTQPINPNHYDDYKNDYVTNEDWIRSSHQAENELKMLNTFNVNKEKFKKEASDFINQYKNQNEFLSNFPTEAAKKYGYTPGETLNPNEFLSKDAVAKAYYAINANKGFPLPQDPTNEMTCINGVCTLESMIGVDFSPMKGGKGVYQDPKTGKVIPQYNPTWLENDNYKKVGYRKLDPNEAPEPGDLAQYTDEGVPHHMELVLGYTPSGQGLFVYNNYSQTNDNKPGEGKEIRRFVEGTYKPQEFEKTQYFRLTPEAAQKAASVNPGYPKWQQEKMEAKKALESSEDYKKFIDAQNLIKTNKEKYDKYSKMSEEWWNWRNGGKTSAQNGQEMRFYQQGLDFTPKTISKDGGWLSKYDEDIPKAQNGYQYTNPDEQKAWLKSYVESPMYGTRLQREFGTKDIDTEWKQRIANLQNSSYSIAKQPLAKNWGYVSGLYVPKEYKGQYYDYSKNTWTKNSYTKDPIKHFDKKGKVYLEPEYRTGAEPFSGFETVPLHEFSHVIDDGGFRVPKRTEQYIYDNTLGDSYGNYKSGKLDFSYTNTPSEFIGRIQPIRYLLNKQGIYDARKQEFNLSHFNKMMKNPSIQENVHFQDVWKQLKGNDAQKKSKFIEMMNRIAKNESVDQSQSSVAKYGSVIEDDMGQWAHPGEITKINSNQITMQGVDYPVLGISDTGDTQLMQPGEDYKFKGNSVTEIPMAQDGITRGGYDDPDYVTGTSRRAFNKMAGIGNYLVPANAINSAADLAKKKGLDYGAITSGPADAVRHASAAASVASRLPVPKFIGQYSPDLDRAIRIAGANLLGIGNEIMSPNSEGLLMDIKNNYQGSLIGSIPGLNQNDRNKMIINQLQKGKLTVDNPKKPKKENGGWLNKYK